METHKNTKRPKTRRNKTHNTRLDKDIRQTEHHHHPRTHQRSHKHSSNPKHNHLRRALHSWNPKTKRNSIHRRPKTAQHSKQNHKLKTTKTLKKESLPCWLLVLTMRDVAA